jgi:hypothetical protein
LSVHLLAVELGQNPAAAQAIAAGIISGEIGGQGAPKLTQALGGDPDAEDLAQTLGGIVTGAAVGGLAGFKPGEGSRPEVLSPREKSGVYVSPSNRLLPDMTVEQGDTAPQKALPVPIAKGVSSPGVRYKDGKPFVQDAKTGWWQPQADIGDGSPTPGARRP